MCHILANLESLAAFADKVGVAAQRLGPRDLGQLGVGGRRSARKRRVSAKFKMRRRMISRRIGKSIISRRLVSRRIGKFMISRRIGKFMISRRID